VKTKKSSNYPGLSRAMTASTSEGAKLLNTAELTVKEIPRERDEEDNLTE
jgi:hypothetical protein